MQAISLAGETGFYQELNAPQINPWRYPTIAAVGPKGQSVIRHLTPDNLTEIGDVPLYVRDGEVALSPRYAKRGWVLYEDLCSGKVPGVAADPDAWKRWQSLVQYNAAGRPLPKQLRDDDKLFHPEVARRRKAGGIEVMPTIEEFRELFPGFDFDDADEDEPAPKRGRKPKAEG